MSTLKQQTDAYLASVNAGKARADARSATNIVNVVGKSVDGLPNARVECLPDCLRADLAVVALAVGNLTQSLSKLGLDQFDGVAADAHASPSVSPTVGDGPSSDDSSSAATT